MQIQTHQKQCYCCTTNIKHVDYKNADFLIRFTTPLGKIGRRRGSGLCAKHQRMVSYAIKRARTLGLMPFTTR